MEKFDEVPSLFGAYNYPKVSVFFTVSVRWLNSLFDMACFTKAP